MEIQQLITLAIGAVAFIALGRHLWQLTHNDDGACSGCGGCGKPAKVSGVREAPQPTPLVTLSVGGRPSARRPSPPGS